VDWVVSHGRFDQDVGAIAGTVGVSRPYEDFPVDREAAPIEAVGQLVREVCRECGFGLWQPCLAECGVAGKDAFGQPVPEEFSVASEIAVDCREDFKDKLGQLGLRPDESPTGVLEQGCEFVGSGRGPR